MRHTAASEDRYNVREESTRRRPDGLWGWLIEGKHGFVADGDIVNVRINYATRRGRGGRKLKAVVGVRTRKDGQKDAYG